MPNSRLLAVAALAAATLATSANAQTTPPTTSTPTTGGPTDLGPLPQPPSMTDGSWTAHIAAPVVGRARPGAGARTKLPAFTPWTLTPSVYMVTEAQDVGGARWVRIQLPLRPNGRSAWVREDQVVLKQTRTWIRVSTAKRTVTVFVGGKKRKVFPASVGTGGTPTPKGLFAIYDPVPTGGLLGPKILVLTAHSNVLKTFAGGDGTVGIHGWPSTVGQAASHGCIRMSRSGVATLSSFAKPGVPVEVH